MKHTRGLMSIAQALRQTFVTPLKPSRAGFLQPYSHHNGFQLRFFQLSRPLARVGPREPELGPVRDEAINAPLVQTVDEAGDLQPPVSLPNILASFDRSKFFLLQLAPGGPNRPPVCKIVNKLEYTQREKAKAKAIKAAKVQTKQIELNWAIDAHDLAYRLKQLTGFLEKGRKVEVTLTRKRHKRAATVDEIKHVIQSVLDTTKDAGGSQIKPMEGEPGKHVKITVKK